MAHMDNLEDKRDLKAHSPHKTREEMRCKEFLADDWLRVRQANRYERAPLTMHDRMKIIFIVALGLPPLLGVVVWPFVALMSCMLFDAPGSSDSPLTIGLAILIFAYPAPTLAGARYTYKNIKAKQLSRCWQSMLLTYGGALAIAIMFVMLDVFCGGKLVCK